MMLVLIGFLAAALATGLYLVWRLNRTKP